MEGVHRTKARGEEEGAVCDPHPNPETAHQAEHRVPRAAMPRRYMMNKRDIYCRVF